MHFWLRLINYQTYHIWVFFIKWTQFFIKSTKIGVFYQYGYIDITINRDPCGQTRRFWLAWRIFLHAKWNSNSSFQLQPGHDMKKDTGTPACTHGCVCLLICTLYTHNHIDKYITISQVTFDRKVQCSCGEESKQVKISSPCTWSVWSNQNCMCYRMWLVWYILIASGHIDQPICLKFTLTSQML